ncbi:selenocysteine-specific translation elongation factor [Ferroacidibacillus organovorans]|uniref:selenocysteine-specific translation elongation factor n=1 Tax=Ferroacidibacillus organovorans TaxID=1765683 RepID=UPI000A60772F|nr:selenocysteine-specific translation elongation factor [Ferroacidibacillus organovorans]
MEDFFIVGTAGHIDHGKTTLVAALTGVDTDRMKEEKERGISIDLGFAPFRLPSGKRIGIVDVPGHERFIRNMLAGAGGMDVILLIVDAREGVMPQTREHLAILSLLSVTAGIVVFTKKDLVDEEWLALVKEETASELKGTFLADAPFLAVSAKTGDGIEALKNEIEEQLKIARPRPREGAFRMPIDRIFSVPGIGTVVTGTVWRGSVAIGDTLSVYPAGERVRVRSVEVHGQSADRAFAGQRAAVSLTGGKLELARGMTLAVYEGYESTRLLDVRIQMLRDCDRPLEHRQRVRVYAGTAELLGRVLMLGTQSLQAGEEGLAQIALEQDAIFEVRDHFVLRSYSPMHTMGGGVVIDPHPPRLHRRHSELVRDRLLKKEQGSPEERVLDSLSQRPMVQAVDDLSALLGLGKDEIEQAIETLRGENLLLTTSGFLLPRAYLADCVTHAKRALETYFERNKYDVFAPKSLLLQMLRERGLDTRFAEDVFLLMSEMGVFTLEGERVRTDREIALQPSEREIYERLLDTLHTSAFAPPSIHELETREKNRDRVVKNMMHLLEQEGKISIISPDLVLSTAALREADRLARELSEEHGSFTMAQFRDAIGSSRKFALAILEYFDRQKRTKRVGDVRTYLKETVQGSFD